MKTILAAAIAAFAIATPAQAQPQWIQVSAKGDVFANYNTVRGTGRIRSVDVGYILSANDRVANTNHIDCVAWRWSFTYEGRTEPWAGIGPGSVAEAVATLICPGANSTPATYGL